MTPAKSSSREGDLMTTLRQSLQGLIMDKSFDTLWGETFQLPQQRALHHDTESAPRNLPASCFGKAHSLELGLLATKFPRVNRSHFSYGKVPTAPSAALGLSSEELLLAAAAETRMLDQARKAAMAQRAMIQGTLQQSRYDKSFAGLQGLVGRLSESSTSKQQGLPQGKDTQNTSVRGMLQTLGGSPRNKDSPYIDVSALPDDGQNKLSERKARGGVIEPFPEKLHRMLREVEEEGNSDVVSFFSHGRAFGVHDPDRFVAEIMPKYFKQSRFSSFQRQLNLYGFTRITSGPDAGGYYHELFLKQHDSLCFHMRRVGIPKGNDRRKSRDINMNPEEPNFYAMASIVHRSK